MATANRPTAADHDVTAMLSVAPLPACRRHGHEVTPQPRPRRAHARTRAAKGRETQDWAHPVQGLLMLAGQDHSAQARRWMAEKLQWPGDRPDDPTVMSAEMNAWLCTRLKAELVKHGSTMPQHQG